MSSELHHFLNQDIISVFYISLNFSFVLGTNSFDQLNRILNLSGTPREEEFTEGSDPEEVQRILSEPFREPLTLSQLLSAEIPAPAEDLASRMLRFNPLVYFMQSLLDLFERCVSCSFIWIL